MKSFTPPQIWDGKKFAARYGLNFNQDLYVDGDGNLVVFPVLPDDPPIFELSDPPGPTKEQILEQEIAQIKTRLTLLETKV